MVSPSTVGQQGSPTVLGGNWQKERMEMCFAPNIIEDGKFAGGLKTQIKGAGIMATEREQEIKKKLKAGTAQIVPCGQCLECRINYAKNWACRCEVESYYHKNNHFITLTYDDEHVPVRDIHTKEEYRGLNNPLDYYGKGKRYEALTLRKKDIQDFLKRLRKWASTHGGYENPEQGIRVFYCGEYGSKGERPHYHMLVYGLIIPDLKVECRKKGYEHDSSEIISKLWGNGLIDIGGVDYLSCQYVSRYIVKKQLGKGAEGYYEKKGIDKEFIQMSLKPAIGLQYYIDHMDEIYSIDTIYLKAGRRQRPPRYFDNAEDKRRMQEELGDEAFEYVQELIKAKETFDNEGRYAKPHSAFMTELKIERRDKATEHLFAQLEHTTKDLVGYIEQKAEKYKNNHKKALMRDVERLK